MSNSTAHLDTQVPFTLSLPLPHTPPLLLLLLTVHATVLQLPLPHLLRQFTGSVTASTSVAPVSVTTPSLPAFSHSSATEASPVSNSFKCEQCNYPNVTNKGLMQHICIKHRIYQIDGTHDLDEECQTNSDEVLLKTGAVTSKTDDASVKICKVCKMDTTLCPLSLDCPMEELLKARQELAA